MPQQATLPPVPRVRTPTDRFRELLAANAEQREVLLSRKPPAARALIEAKLREFGALRPDEREIRLRLAQFQDSLRTLLPLSPSERGPVMASVPEEDLPWIEERLVAWDQLPESERRDVLESERRLSWFVRQAGAEPDRRSAEAYVATLPPAERARKAAAFSRFFDLKASEREAALGTLSQTERQQMERALSDFAALTPEDRERCVRGFQKFEALSPAEREQFLRRAERWKAMSPNDRAAWRRLVQKALTPSRKPPFPAEETMLAAPPR